MGKATGIAWTRSSFNPWWGCQAVSPGCDHCYAEAWAKRTGRDFNKRTRTSVPYWKQPLLWDKLVARERETGRIAVPTRKPIRPRPEWQKPGFWPVFPSLCDPFDNEVPEQWRVDFFRLIDATPNLTWLLLTKRIGNVEKMHPGGDYENVWLGASIVNQPEADRDLPKLMAVRGVAKLFVSYEPALGPVDFSRFLGTFRCDEEVDGAPCDANGFLVNFPLANGVRRCPACGSLALQEKRGIDQIIVGGESSQGGKQARPFDLEWARSTVRQCREAGVACFVKQLGSNPINGNDSGHPINDWGFKDRAGADPDEWPEDLRVQEFPA